MLFDQRIWLYPKQFVDNPHVKGPLLKDLTENCFFLEGSTLNLDQRLLRSSTFTMSIETKPRSLVMGSLCVVTVLVSMGKHMAKQTYAEMIGRCPDVAWIVICIWSV